MTTSAPALLASAIALTAACLPAAAVTFSGSFSGIARVQPMLGGDPDLPSSFYDGATITGTFSGYVPQAHLATYDPEYYFNLGGGQTLLTFEMKGKRFEFPSVPSTEIYPAIMGIGDATPDRPYQGVTFYDMFFLKYAGASFSFESPPETLFQNGDVSTLRIGPDTVTAFDAYFKSADDYIFVDVDILSFSLAVAPPVPEPPAWALSMVGLLAVGVAARRRRTH